MGVNDIHDVFIIGGGIVGLSAALAMSQRHFSVALVDAGSLTVNTDAVDPRVYAINRASQSLLETLGVWDRIDKTRMSPYQHMHVWDAVNGAHIDFDARMVASDRLGTILEESIIKQALLQQVSQQNITLFPHCRVTAVEATLDKVTVDDGKRSWQAKLLMVADGGDSAVRQLLGVPITSWPYHQQAIVTIVHTEKPHHRTAYQVFNPDGPLAFLPLAHPHQCSIVWSTSTTRAESLMHLPDAQFVEQLNASFAPKLGACSIIDKRYSFPLRMRHAKQYSGPRWLLMGDAAHTIHPLAGLGLNLGLADLSTWLTHFGESQLNKAPVRQLGAYQRQRKHAVWKMIALMEGLKTVFAQPLPPFAALRGFGLRICDRFLPLKRFFIDQAAD